MLPADACRASWERLLGLAGGIEMVGPVISSSAGISLATHVLELLESSTAPGRDLHPGDSQGCLWTIAPVTTVHVGSEKVMSVG